MGIVFRSSGTLWLMLAAGKKRYLETHYRSSRKKRFIKDNAKCRHLKNWPVEGFFGRCLSEFVD